MYIWDRFWDMWTTLGEDFSMSDIMVYRKLFAPAMSSSDIAQLMSMQRHASVYIQKMKNGEV